MKQQRITLLSVTGGSVLAAGILFVSLWKTASIQASADLISSSDRRFYLAADIKPDHVLYPVKGGFNSLHLQMISPVERVKQQVTFAQQKIDHAEYLLSQADSAMALVTLQRGHHYLQQAADQAIALEDPELADLVQDQLQTYQQKVSSVSGQFSSAQQAALNQMKSENQAVQVAVESLE